MKLQLTILMVLVSITLLAQDGWVNQIPESNYPGIVSVYAIDASNIWVAGEEGIILHSTDGGLTWIELNCGISVTLTTVEFIDENRGWVAGSAVDDKTTIAHTKDAGENWEFRIPAGFADYVQIMDIDFIKKNDDSGIRGFAAGGLGHISITDDLGENWEIVSGNCGEGNFWSCCIIDENTGWFVGMPSATNYYTILKTSDAGLSFENQVNPTEPEQPLREVCFIDNMRGLAVGLVGTILYTDNGGETWEARPNDGYRWESVYLLPSGKAWAVGDRGKIAYSEDFGYTWEMQQSNVDCELWEVFFINDNEGWIVGGGIGKPGVILHTTNSGKVVNIEEMDASGERFILMQNHPNPFKNSTRISYMIEYPGFTAVKIFDLLGNEVISYVNDFQEEGKYDIEINGDDFKEGFYFYQLVIDDIPLKTRRMLILR